MFSILLSLVSWCLRSFSLIFSAVFPFFHRSSHHPVLGFHSRVTPTHPASAPVWPDRPKVYGPSGICVVVAATPHIAPARAPAAAAPRGQRLPTSSGPAELPRTSWCNVSIAQQQLLLLHVLHDHSYDGLHVIQPFVFI